tara:strand:- start:222 stop:716 length:495 start_codon:yes stop_codon:yes gene_type:complete
VKLLMENWREYLAENDEALSIQTMGDLRQQINKAKTAKRAQQGKDIAADTAAGEASTTALTLLGAALGIPLGGVANVAGLVRQAWKLPDDKVTGTGMDQLQIDDEISAIVSDDAENNFLNNLDDYLGKLPDETLLRDVNMNKLLRDFLAANYGQRTITSPELKE